MTKPSSQLHLASGPTVLRDLSEFALPAGLETIAPSKKLLTNIPVRKPGKEQWVRTVSDEQRWRPWPLLELKEESAETYLVHSGMLNELVGEPTLVFARLVLTITNQGVLFWWPIRLPGPDGRLNPWHESAQRAAETAKDRWVRIVANRSLGGYDVYTAQFQQEPQWPVESDDELIAVAFRGRMLTSVDHPVVLRLRGLR
jgi:hypothetical protein